MSDGGQTQRPRPQDEDQPQADATTEAAEQPDRSDVDDLLDEIDAVLETNAEEFVKNYVQKGGQ